MSQISDRTSTVDESIWFCTQDMIRLGPFTFLQLKQMARDGLIQADDAVLRKGEQKWVTACSVPGLFVEATLAPKADSHVAGRTNATITWKRFAFVFSGVAVAIPLTVTVWFFATRSTDPPVELVDAANSSTLEPKTNKLDNPNTPEPKPKESEGEIFLRRGREQVGQRNFQSAFDAFTQAINRDSTLAWAYVDRAETAFNLRKLDQSIADCTDGIRLAPPDDKNLLWTAHMRRGYAYRDKKDLDQAIADFTEAIKNLPNHGHGYFWRGKTLGEKNHLDRSIADLSDAIRLTPDDKGILGQAFEHRGDCYRGKGKSFAAEAIADYTESLNYQPRIAAVYYRRALAYTLQGDRKSAEPDFAQAKKLGHSESWKETPPPQISILTKSDIPDREKEAERRIAELLNDPLYGELNRHVYQLLKGTMSPARIELEIRLTDATCATTGTSPAKMIEMIRSTQKQLR